MGGDVQAEIAQIHELMVSDRRQYETSGADDRLRELYALEDATAQPPEPAAAPDDGLPRMLTMAEAQEAGLDYSEHVAEHRALADVLLPLEGGTRRALAASFESLPTTWRKPHFQS